ncbi:hypothetical protein OJ252_3397 [Cryptosporidium canis]|uniref:Uncharacterized protein n=1 Tax=Cryptosporidium canis TaxID=195482 RepID=A0ABQ8P2G9_9CRYT|nr:hypothetical protein OJ252_3397 [Cryptosporidium canis]
MYPVRSIHLFIWLLVLFVANYSSVLRQTSLTEFSLVKLGSPSCKCLKRLRKLCCCCCGSSCSSCSESDEEEEEAPEGNQQYGVSNMGFSPDDLPPPPPYPAPVDLSGSYPPDRSPPRPPFHIPRTRMGISSYGASGGPASPFGDRFKLPRVSSRAGDRPLPPPPSVPAPTRLPSDLDYPNYPPPPPPQVPLPPFPPSQLPLPPMPLPKPQGPPTLPKPSRNISSRFRGRPTDPPQQHFQSPIKRPVGEPLRLPKPIGSRKDPSDKFPTPPLPPPPPKQPGHQYPLSLPLPPPPSQKELESMGLGRGGLPPPTKPKPSKVKVMSALMG